MKNKTIFDVIFIGFVTLVLFITFWIHFVIGCVATVLMGLFSYGYVSTIIREYKASKGVK